MTTLSVSPDGQLIATASSDGAFDYHLIVRHGVESFVSVPSGSSAVAEFSVSSDGLSGTVRAKFDLVRSSRVRLRVVDLLGRVVAEPVNGVVEAGPYESVFPVGNLPAGTYLCALDIEGVTLTQTLLLLR